MKKKKISFLIGFILLLLSQSVFAFDWSITGHITDIETSYLPNWITFRMDAGSELCPAGTFLIWDGSYNGVNPTANVKATYAGLLTAMTTAKQVLLYGNNDGCKGAFLHILQ